MKAEVVIKKGRTKVVLLPENDFETDVIEKIYEDTSKYEIKTTVLCDYNYGSYNNQRIEMNLIKEKIK